ncbi:hypothetical protein WDU94_010689 [Cyamophila willieti]
MLYKETNVLNQDFTSSGSGGVANTSSSSLTTPSPPLTLAGDSNSLDVGVTSSMGAEFERKINRTRVAGLKSEIGNYIRVPVTTASSIPEDTPTTLPSKYKLRKPTLLGNGTKKTPFETNTILPDPSTRKPVVKNNIKNRLSTTRTKIHSTTTPVPATTMPLMTTEDEEESEEVEMSTQFSSNDDPKPTTFKPIHSFAQKKRPHNKLNYLLSSGEAKDSITTLPPVKLSTNTRARKPTQASTTEASLTTTPSPKKIKPFVNWSTRLQKVSTSGVEEGAGTGEITTIAPDDDQQDKAPLTPPSVGVEPATPRLTSVQTTTPFGIGRDEITTAKLFENTIPIKANNDKKKQTEYEVSDESKNKEDSRFTVKDFISKFNEDANGDNSEETLSKPSSTNLKIDLLNGTSENSIHSAASPVTDSTTLTTGPPSTLSSQLTYSDSTTKGSTVEHLTTLPNYPVTIETLTENEERKPVSFDKRPDTHETGAKTSFTDTDEGPLTSEGIMNTSIRERLETFPTTDGKIITKPVIKEDIKPIASNETKPDTPRLDNVGILEDITAALEKAHKTHNFEETNIADLTRPEGENPTKETTDEPIKFDKEDANTMETTGKVSKETDVDAGKTKNDRVDIKEPHVGNIETSDNNEASDRIKDSSDKDKVSDSDNGKILAVNGTDAPLLDSSDTKHVKHNGTNEDSTFIDADSNEETQSVTKEHANESKSSEDNTKMHEGSQDESNINDEIDGSSNRNLVKEGSNRDSWSTRPITSSTTQKFDKFTGSTTDKLTSPSMTHYLTSSTTQTSSTSQKLTSSTSAMEQLTTSTPTDFSEPWRSNFSEFFSKFDVTTEEHWGRPATQSKPTSEEVSTEDKGNSSVESILDNGSTILDNSSNKTTVENSSENSDIGSKAFAESSNDGFRSSEEATTSINTLVSSVTPPTVPTSVTQHSMTTEQQSNSDNTRDTTITTKEVATKIITTKQPSVVTHMTTGKQPGVTKSSTEEAMRKPAGPSTKTPHQSFEYPVTLEGDFYSVEDMSPPLTPPPPMIEDPKHYIQLTIHSTPAEICASIPAIAQAVIGLFQYGSMRVQSPDQMRVKNQDLLCTSPDMKESLLFVEFYLTDGMGAFDRISTRSLYDFIINWAD